MMQTGCILLFSIFPVVLEGCCGGNYKEEQAGLQQETTEWFYRAVEGEMFTMPCYVEAWSRTGNGRGKNEDASYKCGQMFDVKVKHSGKYTSQNGSSSLFLTLQVVEKASLVNLGCFQANKTQVRLVNGAGGHITCPGKCSNNTDVQWFKGKMYVSQQRRSSCVKDGVLHLCEVKADFDNGVFFCDRQITERELTWTMRRAVTVTVIPFKKARSPPRFAYPLPNTTEEVERGQSHNLTCDVFFPFEIEIEISAQVLWYVSYDGNEENMTLLPMDELRFKESTSTVYGERGVTRRAFIKEVTQQHLNYTYTCIANNSIGSQNVTIKLVEKKKVTWPSVVAGPVVSLVLVAGLGIVVHMKWLELKIIYRSHFPLRKQEEEEKKFDVFLSYVWSPPSPEEDGGSGAGAEEDAAHSSIMNPLNAEEGEASSQRRLEALLHQVLEGRWGYRLFLLERDVLPGGVYTNDVALALQRSQMLICLLSADYLCNNNAVFVLETGVQALLQNSGFKVLLIRTNRESAAPLSQQDPPLPTLVQRALKVLPSLNWTSGRPTRATRDFWRSLRKAMPDDRVKLMSQMQEQG